jgi:hypothetical protein
MYSDDDVSKLWYIWYLTDGRAVNIAGVKMVETESRHEQESQYKETANRYELCVRRSTGREG